MYVNIFCESYMTNNNNEPHNIITTNIIKI